MKEWVKRGDGWVSGVFEGLGHKTGINPNAFRIMWLISLLLFGSGIFLYLLLVLVLPSEYGFYGYSRPKFLGVCYELSRRFNIDLGITRLLAVGSFILTGGAALLVYFILWIVLPEEYYGRY